VRAGPCWGHGSPELKHKLPETLHLIGTRNLPGWIREEFGLPKAAIFDLDGTLLDSVDLHALAWQEALLKFGHDVSFEQARSQIGKGGDKLIPVFLSADEQRDHGEDMEKWRGNRFKTKYLPLVRRFRRFRCCSDGYAAPDFELL
jgi:phosphoglycolate phosphatase-like HAD superfamily hydrolase